MSCQTCLFRSDPEEFPHAFISFGLHLRYGSAFSWLSRASQHFRHCISFFFFQSSITHIFHKQWLVLSDDVWEMILQSLKDQNFPLLLTYIFLIFFHLLIGGTGNYWVKNIHSIHKSYACMNNLLILPEVYIWKGIYMVDWRQKQCSFWRSKFLTSASD